MKISEAKLERLSTAWSAYLLADSAYMAAPSFDGAKRCIRAQNVLLDTCVECGMDLAASELEFAARVVTDWLRKAA